MNDADWTFESEHTIPTATPETRESFHAVMRAKLEEDYGVPAADEEVEQMTAFAWGIRAEELCAKADVLYEEGVPVEEVRRIVKVEHQPGKGGWGSL